MHPSTAAEWNIVNETEQFPVVLPIRKPCSTRRVGLVSSLASAESLGSIIGEDGAKGAVFCIDDVEPNDREKIAVGQAVCFQAATNCDGLEAKQIRIDTTTLPPPPADGLVTRGWR